MSNRYMKELLLLQLVLATESIFFGRLKVCMFKQAIATFAHKSSVLLLQIPFVERATLAQVVKKQYGKTITSFMFILFHTDFEI